MQAKYNCHECKAETQEGSLRSGVLRCAKCTSDHDLQRMGYSDCIKCNSKLSMQSYFSVYDFTGGDFCHLCGYKNYYDMNAPELIDDE